MRLLQILQMHKDIPVFIQLLNKKKLMELKRNIKKEEHRKKI